MFVSIELIGIEKIADYAKRNPLVLAPSHRELLRKASVFQNDAYETPFGKIKIDKDLAENIVKQDAETWRVAAPAAGSSMAALIVRDDSKTRPGKPLR